MPQPFDRISFSRQFLLASTICLVAGMLVMGTWLSRQIERSSVNRAAAIAAVYVESILAAQTHDWLDSSPGAVPTEALAILDRIFIHGPLKRKVVRFKLWRAGGQIVYSSDHRQIGSRFPVDTELAAAFDGTVQARISDLTDDDNSSERERWNRLLEVYVPVRMGANGDVAIVAEFYHSMENLGRDIRQAQRQSWILVTVTTLAIYLALLGLVRRASDTIVDQQRDLRDQLRRLHASLAENRNVREQLREAGAQTTALNEQFLHRIAADLHDGPAQELAFALLRFGDLIPACGNCPQAGGAPPGDLERIHCAVRAALDELRGLAAGLGIPGIGDLSLADTMWRAISDVEHKTASRIDATIDESLGEDVPIATKITAYRVLQESLTNAVRHSPGHPPQARIRRDDGAVEIEVVDDGTGFDPAAAASGHLGIAFMRERVRLLGGIFNIASTPGRGTRVYARLPVAPNGPHHD